MATFSIENFGCRATDADATAIRRGLLAEGLSVTPEHASADVIVLNTCTVTAAADSQAREAIRKIRRANPSARIIVTGCYAQRAPEELAALDAVDWVVGNSHQLEIPGVARKLTAQLADMTPAPHAPDTQFVPLDQLVGDQLAGAPAPPARGPARILSGDIFAQQVLHAGSAMPVAGERTRPILKIQDGCNNRCSYCVIPFVRGRSRSLAPDAVIQEVRTLVGAGVREIVLSGINLGSYGRDLAPRAELAAVVRRILAETSIEQVRFSSIEPQDVTEDFVALVASSERLAPHFHVPLQSGSDRILRNMHRWYRAAHYAERIKLIRQRLPHAAIGADVIAGFPGETDEDFRATATFIDGLPFTYLHVFSFSVRPGTAGDAAGDPVPPQTIRERARTLRALGEAKAAAFRASHSGRTMRALTLGRSTETWTEALTGNYLKLRIAGHHAANEWHRVRVNITGESKTIEAGTGTSAFEDHLSHRQVAAVGNGE